MNSMEKIIESVSLPLVLPEEAFALSKEFNSADPLFLLNELPEDLRNQINMDDYVSIKRYDGIVVYRFELFGGTFLKIKLQNRSIIEIKWGGNR